VTYAGQAIEEQDAHGLIKAPLHPYTSGLLASRPNPSQKLDRIPAISGRPMSAYEVASGCRFAKRCPHAEEKCVQEDQRMVPLENGLVACRRAGELRGTAPSEAER
jgi:oligopeptide/dipeptide ABC transporter ATP-binding protein